MANLGLVRDINEARVLDLLRRRQASSRAELAQELELTRSTVGNLVSQLIDKGYVAETDERVVRHRSGRPGTGLEIDSNGAYFVGADLGVGHLKVIAVNLSQEVVAKKEEAFDVSAPPDQVIQHLAGLIERLLAESRLDRGRLLGMGVTVPATRVGGTLLLSPLLGWRDVDVRSPLEAELGHPVFVENDANAAALAQLYDGNDPTNRNLLYLLLGAGIGAGIVINGRIYPGSFGAAGEVGYVRLAPDGPVDRRGSHGTLEAYAGAPAVLDRYRALSGATVGLVDFLSDLEDGVAPARQVANEWGEWLGRGILSLMNVLNPQQIVIGGPLSPMLPWVHEPLVQAVRNERLPGSESVVVEGSRFGADDNAMGGAILVYQLLFANTHAASTELRSH